MENLFHKPTSTDIVTVIRTENQASTFSGVLPTGSHFAGSMGRGAAGAGGSGRVSAVPLETAVPKHPRLLSCL